MPSGHNNHDGRRRFRISLFKLAQTFGPVNAQQELMRGKLVPEAV
jgi:hypothetical protein